MADCPLQPLFQEIAQVVPSMHGWCTVEKAHDLAEMVVHERPRLCAEIGVFGGRSLLPIAAALRYLGEGFVVGIDPWDKDSACAGFDPEKDKDHLEWWGGLDYGAVFLDAFKNLKTYRDVCSLFRGRADQAARIFARESIDLLHIDGNHSLAGSCCDVVQWAPLVRPGGIMVFDDMDWPETEGARGVLGKLYRIEQHRGTWAVFRKPLPPDASDA